MEDLTTASCAPCRGGEPPLNRREVETLVPLVPGWTVVERDGVARLVREFTFKDFRSAMELAVKIGALADAENHHPDLHVSWGRLGVEIWTHAVKGLHRNDFVLAAKIGRMLEQEP